MRTLVSLIVSGLITLLISTAYGQTSREIVKKDYRAQYRLIKRLILQDIHIPNDPPNKDEVYDLTYCSRADPSYGTGDQLTHELAALANETALIAGILSWLQYPDSVWGEPLDRYESGELARMLNQRETFEQRQRFSDQFVEMLNSYRDRENKLLPKVDWEQGCGGTGTAQVIRTDPPRGKVLLLPVFFYRLCTLQNIDASDPTKCNQGTEFNDGEEVYGSGVYHYFAIWSGNRRASGRKDFSNAEHGSQWYVRYMP